MILTIINRNTTSRTEFSGNDDFLNECLRIFINDNELELSDLIICKRG